jgi:hypothetical protein
MIPVKSTACGSQFGRPRRGFCAVLLVLSLLCGCQKSAQEKAIDEVIRLGGNVTKDGQLPGMPVITVVLAQSKVTDGELQVVKSFPELRTLDLRQTVISDNGLVHLLELTNLQNLYLDSTLITDRGLERLRVLKGLRKLTLGSTEITDVGAAFLKEFPHLTEVSLKDTQVSDDVIAALHKARPDAWILRDSQSVQGLSTLQPGKRPSRRPR